jgi:hypothetical protein
MTRPTRPKAEFRFTLDGVGRLEELPLADVAELLRGLVGMIARGAAEELNRPITGVGRWEGPVEQASALRLVSLHSGSVVAEVLRPPLADGLLVDADTLTDQAFARVFRVIEGGASEHPTIAGAMADVLDRFSGRPAATLRVEDLREGRQRKATVSVGQRTQLRSVARAATIRPMDRDITGRIFEADLEEDTAKVRTAAGEKVEVSFPPELQDEVRRSLGSRAELRGELVYDPKTNKAKSLRAHEIVRGDQLAFGGVDFWNPKSLDELVAEQRTGPITDPSVLSIDGATDDEWEAFFGAIGVAR